MRGSWLTEDLTKAWGELIRNYQEAHTRDLQKREKNRQQPEQYLGNEPGKTAWSVHIYKHGADKLKPNDLAYAEVQVNDRGLVTNVTALYPVMISRGLHKSAPVELLPHSLLPLRTHTELSPADRVFGWVNQDGHGAYRGNLRIGFVTCTTPQAMALRKFNGAGIPLAILGEPKPQQARFYVANSDRGEAQASRQGKQVAGYRPGKGLRGRKVYPHHRNLPANYWDQPEQDRTQMAFSGHFQEYRRTHKPVMELDPEDRSGRRKRCVRNSDGTFTLEAGENNEQRDDQNRSLLGWVEPNTVFSFDLNVTNLLPVELGAILWLLTLDTRYHFRLGGGKPLGFGSVQLTVDPAPTLTDLRLGAAWKDWYSSLDDIIAPKSFADIRKETVTAFQGAVGQPFDNVLFIRAFLKAAEGFDKPIHYPRVDRSPHPEGKSYEWFVANDREQQGQCLGLPLDNLVNDQGLPYLP